MAKGAFRKARLKLAAGDVILVFVAVFLSFLLRFGRVIDFPARYTGAFLFGLISFLAANYIMGLYSPKPRLSLSLVLPKVLAAQALALLGAAFLFYGLPRYKFGRGLLLLQSVQLIVFFTAWRLTVCRSLDKTARKRRVALVGTGPVLERLALLLAGLPGYEVVRPHISVSGHEDALRASGANDIVVEGIEDTDEDFWQTVFKLKLSGIGVSSAVSYFQRVGERIPLEAFRVSWFATGGGYVLVTNPFVQRAKRLFDAVLSAVCLVLLLPAGLFLAVLVKLGSRGPVFYKQDRVGKNGRVFRLLKFRTMAHEAEKETGAVWAATDDARIRGLGGPMRKYRLDEIPQLVNIFKGDMSFVGPRPERPEFVAGLEKSLPFYAIRSAVPPGLTGWAQVNYPYGASVEDAAAKLEFDLYYIKNLSLMLEARTLIKTVESVLFGGKGR